MYDYGEKMLNNLFEGFMTQKLIMEIFSTICNSFPYDIRNWVI